MSKVIFGKLKGYKRERVVLIKDDERFVECGLSAMRDMATGKLIKPQPIYMKEREENRSSGFTYGEEQLLNGIASTFAQKYREYLKGEMANEKKLIEMEKQRHEIMAAYLQSEEDENAFTQIRTAD